MKEQWVCLWNEEQKCEHIEQLEDYVNDSLSRVLEGEPQKWVLVFVGSSKEASNFGTKIYKMRTEK